MKIRPSQTGQSPRNVVLLLISHILTEMQSKDSVCMYRRNLERIVFLFSSFDNKMRPYIDVDLFCIKR